MLTYPGVKQPLKTIIPISVNGLRVLQVAEEACPLYTRYADRPMTGKRVCETPKEMRFPMTV